MGGPDNFESCPGCGAPLGNTGLPDHLLSDCALKPSQSPQTDVRRWAG